MSTSDSRKNREHEPLGYHRGGLHQLLIDTGLQIIAESGVRTLTLRELSNRLKISRMAPYRHFPNKAALLAAITAAGFHKFVEALTAALQRAPASFDARADALGVA